MESIQVDSLTKVFGHTRALDDVNVAIRGGELFFLLGASGCGKTTLLRCIAGLEKPDSGSIHFGDRDVTHAPPHRRETAMVFQNYALWPHLTAGQNIAFGLEERRMPKPEIKRLVSASLEMVRMPGFENRTIDQMSGGQQQRISLARALVVKPKCLLLDEPLSNLDARLRVEMRREIRRIVKANGLTAIYVTHDQEEALAMADRIAILDQGRICQIGTPESVYRAPLTSHVARFIGETNFLKGIIKEISYPHLVVRTDTGDFRGHATEDGWQPSPGDRAIVSIRPESWRLQEKSTGGNFLRGTISGRVYLGQSIQYLVDTALGQMHAIEMNPHEIRPPGDDPVTLQVHEKDVVILKP